MQFEFDLKICDGVDLVMDFDCKFEKDPVPVLTWFLGTERVNPVEYLITRPFSSENRLYFKIVRYL